MEETQAIPSLILVRSKQFKRDIKRAMQQQGKDSNKLKNILKLLSQRKPLPKSCLDHALLHGQWKGYREVHIEPDWLLIYYIDGDTLHLVRTGSHSALFKK